MSLIFGRMQENAAKDRPTGRRRHLAAVLCVVSMCLASPAISQQEDDVIAFIAAIEALGCVLKSDEQADAIEERTGFDHDRMSAIVAVLLQDGRLELLETMDGIRLTTPGCE